jgi:hypothetical protein
MKMSGWSLIYKTLPRDGGEQKERGENQDEEQSGEADSVKDDHDEEQSGER